MNNEPNKLLNYIAGGTLVLAGILLASFYYLYFFDGNPPAVVNSPVDMDRAAYQEGDIALMSAEFCRFVDSPATLYSSFDSTESNLIWGVPIRITNVLDGCGVASLPLPIPSDLPPGEYIYRTRAVYHVNFLVDRSVNWSTEPFTVLPKEE